MYSCRFDDLPRSRRWLLHWLPVTSLALAACGTHGEAARAPNPPAAGAQVSSGQPPRNQCDAQAAQFLVGQPVDDGTLARALAAAGADTARLLAPGSVTTKEYRMGRLNVLFDHGHRIARVYCG